MLFNHTLEIYNPCPHCGSPNNRVSRPTGMKPEVPKGDGDCLSICFACGKPAMFTENLKLRRPTPEEMEKIKAEPDYQEAMRQWTIVQVRGHA